MAVDAESGTVTRVPGRWAFAGDIEWLPDGRAFALPAADFSIGGGPQIWQVSYPSGQTRRITNDLNSYVSATFSSDGRSLVTVQAENSPNLWIAPASDLGGGRQITTGRARGDGLTGTAWTPDGRIVYGSLASGRPQIWIVDADGANARQLTADDAPSMQPDVTPDGRYVVFQRFGERGVNIWRMGLDGSDPRQLTQGGADIQPRAGPRDVFFNNGSSGQPRPFKVSIDGGEPVSLGAIYFRPQQVSPDGSRLLGTTWDEKARRPAVAMMPVAGGAVELVPDMVTFQFAWGPDANGLTYWQPKQGVQFYRYDLTTKKSEPIGLLRDNMFGFAWARDGKRMAIARGPSTTDVVLISAKSKTP
jgi:dipeptidyl aminopeptidase/acylaminoacyl peptidase